tara:strand:- start:1415 stop:2155 length:741 start_codon:yes stop_codon:yes gene_type:complete
MKNTCIVIPARYQSTRFPGKPLINLLGKPMIIWVAELANKVLQKKDIYIATDNDLIEEIVLENNFNCIKTSNTITGTDRVALASKELKYDIFINIQGDEPLLDPRDIEKCIKLKQQSPKYVFNGFNKMSQNEDPSSNNVPKLVTNDNNDLIYISRSLIPAQKQQFKTRSIEYKKQVCIYGFSKEELSRFYDYGKKSYLEEIEDIEILRFLELNTKIKMFRCSEGSIAVDIPSDVKKVEELLKKNSS